jgi:hypothetical protein
MSEEQDLRAIIQQFNSQKETYPQNPLENEVFQWCEENEIYDVSQHDLPDENGENTQAQWQLTWPVFVIEQDAPLIRSIYISTDSKRNPTHATMHVHTGNNLPLKIFVFPEKVPLSEQTLGDVLSRLKAEADKITTEDLKPFSGLTA